MSKRTRKKKAINSEESAGQDPSQSADNDHSTGAGEGNDSGGGNRLYFAELRPFLFAAGFALLLRAIYLMEVKESPVWGFLIGDAITYDAWAQKIASGNWLGKEVFYQAPFYPYFLGVVYSLFGRSLMAIRVIQVLLGAGSCLFLGLAGKNFFSKNVGVAAGLILAVYPPAIYFDVLVQKTSLGIFLLCLALFLLSKQLEKTDGKGLLPIGLILGCLVLTRENAMAFAAVVAAWLMIHFRQEPRGQRLRHLAWFAAGLAIVLFPVALRNKVVGGEFHVTTSQFGPNFFIGNNENADGTYRPLVRGHGNSRLERTDATRLAEQVLGKKLSPGQVSAFWAGRAFKFIMSRPRQWVRLMWEKWMLVWNAVELADTESIYTFRSWSDLMDSLLPWLHFGTLCPLAVFGIWASWEDRRKLWLLAAMMFIYAGSVVLFYVFDRYRFPLVPFAALFAAAGLLKAWQVYKKKAYRSARLGAALTVAAALFMNWPIISSRAVEATGLYNAAGHIERATRNIPLAIKYYKKSLDYAPYGDQTHLALGRCLLQMGKIKDAIARLEDAIQLRSDLPEAHYLLGAAFTKAGELDKAEKHYRAAIKLKPNYPEAQKDFGNFLAQMGKMKEAAPYLLKAVELKPDYAEAHSDLGNVLLSLGKPDEALRQYEEATRLMPDLLSAHLNKARFFLQTGQGEKALGELQELLKKNPNSVPVKLSLGRTLASLKRYNEALSVLNELAQKNPRDWKVLMLLGSVSRDSGNLHDALRWYGDAVRLNPMNLESQFKYVNTLFLKGDVQGAIDYLRDAVKDTSGMPQIVNRLAWILATHETYRYRNAEEALRYARYACESTKYQVAPPLDTLAAAYAEAKQYDKAVATAEKALAILKKSSAQEKQRLEKAIRHRLNLYRHHQPYHEPVLKKAGAPSKK